MPERTLASGAEVPGGAAGSQSSDGAASEAQSPGLEGEQRTKGCSANTVGLGIYFNNGVPNLDFADKPTALHVLDGPCRYVQELYITARTPTTEKEGLAPVIAAGDLSKLDWRGVHADREDWRLDADGVHWVHQVFFRGARWMDDDNFVIVVPLDAGGEVAGEPLVVNAGRDDVWRRSDGMFERRYVARVLTTGCVAKFDCTNPEAMPVAEGLVQLRGSLMPEHAVRIPRRATELAVLWTADIGRGVVRRVPVVHDAPDRVGYGLHVSITEVAPPARGFYLPGERVAVRVKYTDNAGRRLFPEGTLPTYGDMLFRNPAALGMRYLNFNDEPILYWAHKSHQSDMLVGITGPIDRMTRIGTTPITPASLGLAQIPAADVAHDGYTSIVQIIPPTTLVFPCLGGLQGAPGGDISKCFAPVSDVVGFDLPQEVLPGTYTFQIKARREFEGEPVHAAVSIRFQVGSKTETVFPPFTVPGVDSHCDRCHTGRAAIPVVGHGLAHLNAIGPECFPCHTSGYYFEPDADIVTRLQIMHSVTHRLGPPK